MRLAEILTPQRVRCEIEASSRKRVLEYLGEVFAQDIPQLTSLEITEELMARERLGSTGVGKGVALPHARLAQTDAAWGAFVQLKRAVPFGSIDDEPVDLIFALLVPNHSTKEHLELLAQLAGLFSQNEFRAKLRQSPQVLDKFQLLTHWQEIIK